MERRICGAAAAPALPVGVAGQEGAGAWPLASDMAAPRREAAVPMGGRPAGAPSTPSPAPPVVRVGAGMAARPAPLEHRPPAPPPSRAVRAASVAESRAALGEAAAP